MKGGRDIPDERLFGFCQIEVILGLAIDELTGIPADRDDAGIVGRSGSVDLLDGRQQLGQRGRCQERIGFRAPCLCRLDVFGVGLRKRLVSGVAGILQPLGQCHRIGFMDIATAGTADDDVMGAVTKERQLLSGCQRQGVTLVLQQHHAFRGSLARDPCMGIQIGPVADGLMTEGSGPHDQIEDAFDVSIQHLHINLALSGCVQQCLLLRLGSRHQQVVACLHLLHGIRTGEPVRHHNALKAPLITQHVLQQPGAFRGPGSVDPVVGTHDRPWTAFLDGDLEALQVQLAQRIAMQVQGRRQKDIDPIGRRFRSHGLAHTFDQCIVPCAGQQRGNRKGGGVEGLIRRVVPRRLDAQTGRPIGQNDRGNAQSCNGKGRAGCTGNPAVHINANNRPLHAPRHAGHALTQHQRHFLFEGHGLDHVANRRDAQPGRRVIRNGGRRHLQGSGQRQSRCGMRAGWL